MTINLPEELGRFLRSEIHRGHFASEEDAIAEAVRLLLQRQLMQEATTTPAVGLSAHQQPDPFFGAFRDAAEEMDAIVREAMKQREQQAWRLSSSE